MIRVISSQTPSSKEIYIFFLYYKHVFGLKPHSSVFGHLYGTSYFSEDPDNIGETLSIFIRTNNLILYTTLKKKGKLLLNILKEWIKNWWMDWSLKLYLGPNKGHWYLALHKCFSNSTESTNTSLVLKGWLKWLITKTQKLIALAHCIFHNLCAWKAEGLHL